MSAESMDFDENGQGFWIVGFPALSLLTASVAFAACSDWLGLDETTRTLAMRGFILVLVCVYGAYVSGEEGFGLRLVLLAVLLAITAAMYMAPVPGWIPGTASLLLYAIVVAGALVQEDPRIEPKAPWRPSRFGQPFNEGIVHAWTVTGILLFAAQLKPFAHPPPRVPEWLVPNGWQDFLYTHLGDLRILTSFIAGTFLVGTSISRAMQLDRPQIPSIPRARLDGLKLPKPVAVLVRPFLHAVVVVWTILRVPADVLWQALAHAAVAFAQVVRELTWLLLQHVFRPGKLIRIGTQVIFFLTLLGLVRGSGGTSATLLDYLRAAPDVELSGTLARLAASFAVGAVGAWLLVVLADVVWLKEGTEFEEMGNRAALCSFVYMFAFAVSGMLMYVLERFVSELRIAGFARLGPVTGSMLALAAVALLALLAWDAWKRRVVPEG